MGNRKAGNTLTSLGQQLLQMPSVGVSLLGRIKRRPQRLRQKLVGDPDRESTAWRAFDGSLEPSVVSGLMEVNGQLAVWSVVLT